ncbi:hypothetical protein BH20ACI4_BH20ACI4_11080 [soil metagenome]
MPHFEISNADCKRIAGKLPRFDLEILKSQNEFAQITQSFLGFTKFPKTGIMKIKLSRD